MHTLLLSTALAAAIAGAAAAQTPSVTAQPPSVAPGLGPVTGGLAVSADAPPAALNASTLHSGPGVEAQAQADAANGALNTSHTVNPGGIKDSTTLATGQAVNSSAIVSDTRGQPGMGLAGGMTIKDMGGMTLGRVMSVTKDSSGRAGNVIIQTTDGVRRSLGGSNLTAKDGFAVTSQSEAQLVGLPAVK